MSHVRHWIFIGSPRSEKTTPPPGPTCTLLSPPISLTNETFIARVRPYTSLAASITAGTASTCPWP